MRFWGMGDELMEPYDLRSLPARQALSHLERCAERGNVGAQLVAGTAYLIGSGSPVNVDAARDLFSRAAHEGSALGTFGLAVIAERTGDSNRAAVLVEEALSSSALDPYFVGYQYFRGLSFPKSYERAAAWFRKGAEKNDPKSQGALSYMYLLDLGVPRNQQEAERLGDLAKRNGLEFRSDGQQVITHVEGSNASKK